MFEELIGRNVVVIKIDGYKKVGLLEKVEDGFVLLRHKQGNEPEYIKVDEISSASLDKAI